MKRNFKSLLCLALALFLLLPMAFSDSADRKASLEIRAVYQAEKDKWVPAPGVKVQIHKVASAVYADGGVTYTYTPEFANCGVKLPTYPDSMGMELSESYYRFAADYENPVKPLKSGTAGADGIVRFSQLDLGLYLVSQAELLKLGENQYYRFAPYLVSIPMPDPKSGGNVSFDIVSSPKPAKVDNPEDIIVKKVWANLNGTSHPDAVTVQVTRTYGKDKTVLDPVKLNDKNKWQVVYNNQTGGGSWSVVEVNPPSGYDVKYSSEKKGNVLTLTVTNTKVFQKKPPILIQTGQLNWPVPVMVVLGLALMGAGWGIVHHGKKEQ